MKEPTAWCARAQFPGRPQFIIGTVGATSPEEAMQGIRKKCEIIFPVQPDFLLVMSGRLVFEAGTFNHD